MAYVNQTSDSYVEINKPGEFQHNVVTDAIKFGLLACLYLFTYFIFLELFQMDTLLTHGIGKFIIISTVVFYAFSQFKKKARNFNMSRKLKFAIVISAVIAFTLILGQIAVLYFANLELVPMGIEDMGLNYVSMNALLFCELVAYSLIASLVANFFGK